MEASSTSEKVVWRQGSLERTGGLWAGCSGLKPSCRSPLEAAKVTKPLAKLKG